MANADYVLIPRSMWDGLQKIAISGNGLKQAVNNPALPRGPFVAIKESDVQDVILVDEGSKASAPVVLEVPAPPDPTEGAADRGVVTESPAAQPDAS